MATGNDADKESGEAETTALLAERDAKVAALETALLERDATIADQTAKIAALTKQVELLTELVNRNSTNSHLPPSSDGPGAGARGGRTERNRRKRERNRGGQKGHRGSHRELLPADRVDTITICSRGRAWDAPDYCPRTSMSPRVATSSWSYTSIGRTSPSGGATRSSARAAAP